MLPLRLGLIGDVVSVAMAAVAVTAIAAAVGASLRATDSSHHATVTAVRRAEREEVARELHDVVAHHVTGMVVLSQAARSMAASRSRQGSVRKLDDALGAVERAGGEAMISLRSMVSVLRQPDGVGGAQKEPVPTLEDLEDLVSRFRFASTTTNVEVVLAPAARTLRPQVQAALHRVVQESLTNASRYAAGARSVSVELTCGAGRAVLRVADSGGSRDQSFGGRDGAPWGGGSGIVGMRERVATLGGVLTAHQGPAGTGWIVRAEVPT